jgi:hypothetical protein
LYLTTFVDLSGRGREGTKELVLTVPPSQTNYYVVNPLDAFLNTVGSVDARAERANLPPRRPDFSIRTQANRADSWLHLPRDDV